MDGSIVCYSDPLPSVTSDLIQVKSRSGEFLSVPSVPGAVLVNIADLMQRWTSDQFVSVVRPKTFLIRLHQPLHPPVTCCHGYKRHNPLKASFPVFQLHRVLLPPAGDSSTRQSLAFFVQSDDEALITCCDGSDKYPPVTGGGYLTERFQASYGAA